MLELFYVLTFLVVLAWGARRYGADSRRSVDTKQMDWTVRL